MLPVPMLGRVHGEVPTPMPGQPERAVVEENPLKVRDPAKFAVRPQASRALAWLNEASEVIAPGQEPGVSLRRLLLLQRFEHRTAKILQVGDSLFLSVMLLAIVAATGSALQGASTDDVAWSYGLFGMLALALRFFAVSAEDSQPQRPGTNPAPLKSSRERQEGQ